MTEPILAAAEAVAVPLAENAAKAVAEDTLHDVAEHPALLHFAGLRRLLAQRVHADFDEIGRALTALERDVRTALADLHGSGNHAPAPSPEPSGISLTVQ